MPTAPARAIQGIGRKQMPSRIALKVSTTAATCRPKIQNKPADRDRHEDVFLPAKGGEIVDGQRGQGEGHEHLKGVALKCSFLDAVNLEDRQEQGQVHEVAQERLQAAPAGFGFALVEARLRARAEGSGAVLTQGRY